MITISLLFLISNVFSFHADFKILTDKLPHDFHLLFETLKDEKDSSNQKEIIGLLQKIELNLGSSHREQILSLVKVELIRSTLENKSIPTSYDKYSVEFIKNFESKLKSSQNKLTPWARWILKGIQTDLNLLKTYLKNQTQIPNPLQLSGVKRQEAQKIATIWRYISPWMSYFVHQSIDKVNQMVRFIGVQALYQLNEKALLFNRFSSHMGEETKTAFFNYPPDDFFNPQAPTKQLENALPLEEKSRLEKNQAQSSVDKIDSVDLGTMSEEINQEIQKKIEGKP